MAKDRMGHVPELVVSQQSIQKWEQCRTCKALRKRGSRWLQKCPGPAKEKIYMGGA